MLSPVISVKSRSISVEPGKRVVFLSDVHLGLGTDAENTRREQLLIDFLRSLPATVAHLFIVGDLFDYWFDYKHVVPRKHVRTLATLAELRRAGMAITYQMGNHDFGHFSYFRDELGIEVEQADLDVTINGLRFYVCHGDGKAANDTGYLILRSVLRGRFTQWLYRRLHPNWGIGLAGMLSHNSRAYTDAKDYGTDGLLHFAKAKIAEGYDVVVMGHRHRATEQEIGKGLYINLGDWLGETATYAEFAPPNTPCLKTLKVYLPNNH